MGDRFSDRARAVLVHSRDEAVRLGHDAIRPEHLLLGLLGEGGAPARALRNLGVNTQRLRQCVEAAAPPPIAEPGEVWGGDLGASSEASAALDRAERAAGEARIEPEHLLVGLVGEEDGLIVGVLRETFRVTAEAVRAEVRRLRGEPSDADPAEPEPAPAGGASASAAHRLTIVFDEGDGEAEVAALLLALSELYRALGGDSLVILDSGVPRWDEEGA